MQPAVSQVTPAIQLLASCLARGIAVSVLMLLTSACSVTRSTALLEHNSTGQCNSALGAYALSKSNIHVLIKSSGGEIYIDRAEMVIKADNSHTYCLDYLSSAFSNDEITVQRGYRKTESPATPAAASAKPVNTSLLTAVTSKAVDMSGVVFRKLIRAVFILLSRNAKFDDERSFTEGSITVLADLEFDPFSPKETADVNDRLREFGFCLVLETYAFDVSAATIDAYCNNPIKISKQYPSPSASKARNQKRLAPASTEGIFYRPRADYTLALFLKPDPGGPGNWELRQIEHVMLENISPVLSIGVKRALFAQRRTALVFDQGVLTDVCIAKGSEVAGAIEIPLDVVYGVVALPSQVLQAQFDAVNSRQELLAAQTKVINAQEKLIQLEQEKIALEQAIAGLQQTPVPLTQNTLLTNDIIAASEFPPPTLALANADLCASIVGEAK